VRKSAQAWQSGTTAYEKLNIQANGTTLRTFSNTSTKGSWFSTAVDLSAYAGQTITVKFQAVNDSTLPTSFYVDVVSVLA
jgi:bacillopeptidase F (M6 metalloprotease family)